MNSSIFNFKLNFDKVFSFFDLNDVSEWKKNRHFTFVNYARWLLLQGVGICLVIMLLVYVLCSRVGEMTPVKEVAQYQNPSNKSNLLSEEFLYGSALHANTFQYKLAILENRKPTIVALGSSRVLQFRQSFFKVPFANLGSNMDTPEEGLKFIEAMLKIHKPKVVIMNIDFWWFNPENAQDREYINHLDDGSKLRFEDYLLVLRWWMQGRFNIEEIFKIFISPTLKNGYEFPQGLGIRACIDGEGFGRDGSEYNYGLINGKKEAWDVRFSQSLSRIEEGHQKGVNYRYGSNFSEKAWGTFIKLIQRLQKENIKIILFLPPIANPVLNKLEQYKQKYQHRIDLKKKITELAVPVFDFENAGKIGGIDSEFIDAHHGGEVLYMRIASQWSSLLVGMMNDEFLQATLKSYSGFTMIPNDQVDAEYELDFLKLGVEKKRGINQKDEQYKY